MFTCTTVISPVTGRLEGWSLTVTFLVILSALLCSFVMNFGIRLFNIASAAKQDDESEKKRSIWKRKAINYITKGAFKLSQLLLTLSFLPVLYALAVDPLFCPRAFDMQIFATIGGLMTSEYLCDLFQESMNPQGAKIAKMIHHLPIFIIGPVFYLTDIGINRTPTIKVGMVLLIILSTQTSTCFAVRWLLSFFYFWRYAEAAKLPSRHQQLAGRTRKVLQTSFKVAGVLVYAKTLIIFGCWLAAYISMLFLQGRDIPLAGADIAIYTSAIFPTIWLYFELVEGKDLIGIAGGRTLQPLRKSHHGGSGISTILSAPAQLSPAKEPSSSRLDAHLTP